jgi:hypothetical protein
MREPSPATWPLYPQPSDGLLRGIRGDVLDAIQEVNEHFLDVLCQSAAGVGANFPLSAPLRTRFAALQVSQRSQAAQCGVLLVDAGFSDRQRWSNILQASCGEYAACREANWLSDEQASSLAHSTFLIAWHVVHASPVVASVLLGMPYVRAIAYAQLSVKDLAYIARRHADWIQPRWQRRPEIWSSILDLATDESNSDSARVTLRCLQLSGGHAPWLLPYVDVEG